MVFSKLHFARINKCGKPNYIFTLQDPRGKFKSWDEANPNKPGHINRHKALQAQLCRFQEATQSPLVGQGLVVRLMDRKMALKFKIYKTCSETCIYKIFKWKLKYMGFNICEWDFNGKGALPPRMGTSITWCLRNSLGLKQRRIENWNQQLFEPEIVGLKLLFRQYSKQISKNQYVGMQPITAWVLLGKS